MVEGVAKMVALRELIATNPTFAVLLTPIQKNEVESSSDFLHIIGVNVSSLNVMEVPDNHVVRAPAALFPFVHRMSMPESAAKHIRRSLIGTDWWSKSTNESKGLMLVYDRRGDNKRTLVQGAQIIEALQLRYGGNYTVDRLEFGNGRSLKETVQLLSRCDVLVACHGAGLTNGLFLKDNATVVEVAMQSWPLPVFQVLLASIGINVHHYISPSRHAYFSMNSEHVTVNMTHFLPSLFSIIDNA
jgi:capsular polysaccharide biosynthesis protein